MVCQKQNPGWQAGASRNQLGRCLHYFPTASEHQTQMLTCRFCLSPSVARDVARLCFGEPYHD